MSLHKEKERIRYNKQMRLLDKIIEHVPKLPQDRPTRVKKLRRLVVYSKFLQILSTKLKQPDQTLVAKSSITSLTNSMKPGYEKIKIMKSLEYRQNQKKSRAHIVFLNPAKQHKTTNRKFDLGNKSNMLDDVSSGDYYPNRHDLVMKDTCKPRDDVIKMKDTCKLRDHVIKMKDAFKPKDDVIKMKDICKSREGVNKIKDLFSENNIDDNLQISKDIVKNKCKSNMPANQILTEVGCYDKENHPPPEVQNIFKRNQDSETWLPNNAPELKRNLGLNNISFNSFNCSLSDAANLDLNFANKTCKLDTAQDLFKISKNSYSNKNNYHNISADCTSVNHESQTNICFEDSFEDVLGFDAYPFSEKLSSQMSSSSSEVLNINVENSSDSSLSSSIANLVPFSVKAEPDSFADSYLNDSSSDVAYQSPSLGPHIAENPLYNISSQNSFYYPERNDFFPYSSTLPYLPFSPNTSSSNSVYFMPSYSYPEDKNIMPSFNEFYSLYPPMYSDYQSGEGGYESEVKDNSNPLLDTLQMKMDVPLPEREISFPIAQYFLNLKC